MINQTDKLLLSELRRNGRAGISELAARIGRTRTTIRQRLQRLEDSGEIVGYTVVLKGDVQPSSIRGIMMLEIEGRGTDRIVASLAAMRGVDAVHSTNGRWDLIVEISSDTPGELDAMLREIRVIEGVRGSETSLLLATKAGLSGRPSVSASQ